jgi:hypothetical protein
VEPASTQGNAAMPKRQTTLEEATGGRPPYNGRIGSNTGQCAICTLKEEPRHCKSQTPNVMTGSTAVTKNLIKWNTNIIKRIFVKQKAIV